MRRLLFVGIVLFIAVLLIARFRKEDEGDEVPIVITTVVLPSPEPTIILTTVAKMQTAIAARATATAVSVGTAVAPTHTPSPTLTLTPTLTTQILFDDHFDGGALIYEGWMGNAEQSPEVKHENDMLMVQTSSPGTIHVWRSNNGSFPRIPDKVHFIEARISLSSESQTSSGAIGHFIFSTTIPLNDDGSLLFECYLARGEPVKVECIKGLWSNSEDGFVDGTYLIFSTQTAVYDALYKVRMEMDAGGKMTTFLNGKEVGSYQLTDAEISEVTQINPSFKIWSKSHDSVKGYVDNVRVGYMDSMAAVLQKLGYDFESGEVIVEPNQEPITIIFDQKGNYGASGGFPIPIELPNDFLLYTSVQGIDDHICDVYFRINEGFKNYQVVLGPLNKISALRRLDSNTWETIWETSEYNLNANGNDLVIVGHSNDYEVYVNNFQNPIKTFDESESAYSNGSINLVGWSPTGEIGDSSCTYSNVWVWAPDS